ncbi:uncharacterized protein Z519_12654 [Cladophialophora bantiana CBS 173.52]|uniref:Potassium channel domain-containing protein n=1 Tax=Cladophialophora bantiana (strain ATCC 10958 / CBS 173.52 / CDC B-1940 / NIH 8579) TaxID=1442370 RepID=A0A0D2E9C8_CLAB1|nr:uncharacterized protein Z519_12654 [Cladophialophora bantiana CBS 173.52]KIW86741.1 hypothetical protein Z519_12654 [Cladophialophora bantiana CBS 173.52]
MNDPGLDEPIADASAILKENVQDYPPASHHNAQTSSPSRQRDKSPEEMYDKMSEEEQERNFLMPARWWYASTGIPLVAGTFGPMANAFSICALVENWRVEIPPGGTEEHGIDITDPDWLIAVNAVSLAFALVANVSLLLNMARRVPFQIAQPITILGFWIASVLLIGLVANASFNFDAPGVKNQALSQPYYYAIFAAGLYQVISYSMCFTVYGAYKGYYSKEFKLTVAQRTLMLQTVLFLVYQLLGALVYSHIEGWKFLDAVYWAEFTSLTIGIGDDYTPKTHLGRGLLFPFAMGGIIILGLVVGSIRSLILERGKKKMAARLTEKTRLRLIKEIEKISKKKGLLRHKGALGLEKNTTKALTLDPGDGEISELERRQAEFEAMRKVQEWAATERKYMSLLVSTFAFAFLWTIGALVLEHTEKNQGWTYFDSLYFSYTTLLTIGYGDFQPMSNSGKPFFVFWTLLAVPTLTILISDMGDTVVKAVKDVTIWLGEITVLPSSEDTISNRLKHGVYKATLGQLDPRNPECRDQKTGENDKKIKDRLAADFEEEEKRDESDARDRGDRWQEDAHHYRHVLLSQIRKVYADASAATPKTYTYEEWQDFLKLLGEDEADASYHRRAPAHGGKGNEARETEKDQQEDKDTRVAQWSWIDPQSPLMGDKEEAEWLLERLFQRLEESLHSDTKQTENAKHYTSDSRRQKRREEDEAGSE